MPRPYAPNVDDALPSFGSVNLNFHPVTYGIPDSESDYCDCKDDYEHLRRSQPRRFRLIYRNFSIDRCSTIRNQTIPSRSTLESRIWQFQRDDGGIRSHYLGNLTSNREANSETAGLVLLAYQFKIQKDAIIAQQEGEMLAEQEARARMQLIQNIIIVGVDVFIVSLTVCDIKTRCVRNRLKHSLR